MKRWILWVPFALFILIGIVVAISLMRQDDHVIQSRMVGQPLPAFNIPPAVPGRAAIDRRDFGTGRPRVINVFASWCVPCAAEAPQLMTLARSGVPIDAVAIRDRPEEVTRFLDQWGDPFQKIGLDRDASVQMSIGSAGVPETFIVDGSGTIRYQHVGVITEADVPTILQKFEEAGR